MIKLSVIIVNYNVEHFLEQCLHSVYKALQNITSEVFVVDNNSVDGSTAMLREKFPQVHLIENKQNTGFSHANNQAIKSAKGEYILLLNPDTVVEENTFSKTILFMDGHSDAGALGVKMLDGKGNFLPESKRGLPTPMVAFYKVFGFSALFPRSKIFGKYHLGFIDKDQTHEVDVLAGAFMLLRRSVLDKTGLLDEQFFMYGEDIDLSYRITQAGYKNYYFPETRIIHYKGESTRKSSLNYVFVFYNAMIIFARKHFSPNHAKTFSLLIHMAIYLRAGVSVLKRFVLKIFIPLLDAGFLLSGLLWIKDYYEKNVIYTEGGSYSQILVWTALPGYVLIWLCSVFLAGGYDKPIKLTKTWRGIFIGTAVILIVYSLLPESYRFSRALILFGTLWTFTALTVFRLFLHVLGIKSYALSGTENKRIAIVGTSEECKRVHNLVRDISIKTGFIGYVDRGDKQAGSNEGYIGNLSQLPEIISVHKIDEVIFCAKDLSSQTIIEQMLQLGNMNIDYKIAPPESLSIIGSSSINTSGDLYVIDVNSVIKPVNKRNKRMVDVIASLVLLISFPVSAFIVKRSLNFFQNIFQVLFGTKSWVGYDSSKGFPSGKTGVLKPSDILKETEVNSVSIERSNTVYIKDYRVLNDINILFNSFRKLGS